MPIFGQKQLLKQIEYTLLHIKFQDNFSFIDNYDFDKYKTNHTFTIKQIITK